MKNHRGLQGARRLFFVQSALVGIVAMFVWNIKGFHAASSFWLGGLIWGIPQHCFAVILFSEQRARFSRIILRRAYCGEAFKLLLSATLFAGIFYFGHVKPLMFFMGYFLAYGVSRFAPLFFRRAVSI